MKRILNFGALGLASLLAFSLLPTRAATKADEARGQLSEKDYQFANEAVRDGILEIKVGELAKIKAADPEVKQFGERMMAEHGKMVDELKVIASTKGASLVTDLDTDQQRVLNRLQNLTGQDFDKAYADEITSGHKKQVKDLRDKAVADVDLSGFASKLAALAVQHLAQSQQISALVNKR